MMRVSAGERYFPDRMPEPTMDAISRPFWEACDAHLLVVQRCKDCGTHRSPPKPACWSCGSFDYGWSESTGHGRVFTYTIAYHCPHPVAKLQVPYNIVVIELDDCDNVLLLSNVIGCPENDLRVDLPVEVVWEDRGDGRSLYRFRPLDQHADRLPFGGVTERGNEE